MTTFFRLLDVPPAEKPEALLLAVVASQSQVPVVPNSALRAFEQDPQVFSRVPGSPFAYWCSNTLLSLFSSLSPLSERVTATVGLQSSDDFRFARLWWEMRSSEGFPCFAKGGEYSEFYADLSLVANWRADGREIKAHAEMTPGSSHWSRNIRSADLYFRPGLTWTPRTQRGLGMRAMPAGCVFGHKGPAIFAEEERLLSWLAVTSSSPFKYLVELQVAFGSYEVGPIQRAPVPAIGDEGRDVLARFAQRAWSLKRMLDSTNETSHAFLLPAVLRLRSGDYTPDAAEEELEKIRAAINDILFRLYGVDDVDRSQIETWTERKHGTHAARSTPEENVEDDEQDFPGLLGSRDAFLSWCVGVSFGRFDERLANGERQAPSTPGPFDPLPARSPGMLLIEDDGSLATSPILVDDAGHSHDLAAHVAGVLARAQCDEPENLRGWLAHEFFQQHIKTYSKSRRKAPIYWQLGTPSASYSAWLYLHAMGKDTLYQLQNDYVAPKVRHEDGRLEVLRKDAGPNPTASQRKALGIQAALVDELRAFLVEVKRVAPLWNPNFDDGVLINFAPLWRLVPHHRAWQRECQATWGALCSGEYDWAHLAMHLWPERVVPKCKTDRGLAIAHGLEDAFWFEDADGKWKARSAPTKDIDALIRERTSTAVKAALTSLIEASTANGTAKGKRGGRKGKGTVRAEGEA